MNPFNFRKRGFLAGAAAERMKQFFQGRHEENLARIGLSLTPHEDDRKIILPNGPAGGTATEQSGFIWDTFTVAPNTAFPSPITMFSTAQSQATKGLAQTNLFSQQNLGGQETLMATGMRLYILNNAIPIDVLAFFSTVSVQLFQGPTNFPVWEGLPWMLPAGGGLWAFAAQLGTAPGGAAPFYTSSNGVPTIESAYQFSIPIAIEALEKFNVQLVGWGATPAFTTQPNTTNPAGTGLTWVLALEGVRTRQISLG